MGEPRLPKKSLRVSITFWFLIFTIVPPIFIAQYSTIRFENSLNRELQKRLEGNLREVQLLLGDYESSLESYGKIHAGDASLSYHVSTRNVPAARRIITEWLRTYLGNKIVVFDSEGRLIIAEKKEGEEVKTQSQLESGDIYLSDAILAEVKDKGQYTLHEVRKGKGLSLVVYSRITQKGGGIVGVLEETKELNADFLKNLKKKYNLEATLFDAKNTPVAASLDDLMLYPEGFFAQKLNVESKVFLDLTSRGEPMGMMVKKFLDKKNNPEFGIGLAASKSDIQSVLRSTRIALLTMVFLVMVLLIPILFFVTNRFVKPLYKLMEATRKMEAGESAATVDFSSDTELGLLIESFNDMSKRISNAKLELEKKVTEVEAANLELKTAQATLIQSEKMASLGQLVAGVAHELNNPIGFIYSNMSHLRDYTEKLKRVLETAEKMPADLEKIKEEVDFNFIVTDLPKLIASCEDGARRTRDIVVGLRNFSRLDEAQLKAVDLHDGIQSTLQLLTGEIKNKIQVHQEYGKLSLVKCYASQINQVFMNIISNAAQSIEKNGNIWIKTWQKDGFAFVAIKDDGSGISADQIEKIFDPFFTTKPVGSGTGLGLSVSFGIVRKHGGDITVTSKVKKGTEFTIKIPISGPPKESS